MVYAIPSVRKKSQAKIAPISLSCLQTKIPHISLLVALQLKCKAMSVMAIALEKCKGKPIFAATVKINIPTQNDCQNWS